MLVDSVVDKSPSSQAATRETSWTKSCFDLKLLDCPICYEPFTIPIFQCKNGHTACSSCCQTLANKCPRCALPIGSIRCLAIENVLESVLLSCKNSEYGCQKESLSYDEDYLEHEKSCTYVPCTFPIPGCISIRSFTSIFDHIYFSHEDCMISFEYDHTFTVSITNDDKFLVLGVKSSGSIFLLNNNRVEQFGNMFTVTRLAPTSSKESYWYDLEAKIDGTSHTFRRSFTKNKFEDKGAPSIGFLLDPISDNGKISLDICIWNQGSTPAAVPTKLTFPIWSDRIVFELAVLFLVGMALFAVMMMAKFRTK